MDWRALVAIRILIVDDSAIFRQGLRTMLESHDGWEVFEAVDGIDGVKPNRLIVPHFIVMDMSMPYMMGIEAAGEILKEFPKVPILLLTLYFTNEVAKEARDTGIRATLSKATLDHLPEAIEAILRDEELALPLGA